MNDNDITNDNLPPFDEERFSEQLRTALDRLERIGLGVCEATIHLENMHSDLLVRKLKREGKEFIVVDEFGKKE